MTAPITVTIDGVPVTTLEESSFRIESVLGQTVDTATLRIYDAAASLAVPEEKDIVITRSDGVRVFGGLTSFVDEEVEGVSRWYTLTCQDYTVLLDTTIVFASYPSGYTYDGLTGDQAVIAALFETAVVGFGVTAASEIEARTYVGQALPGMAAVNFQYVTLREALNTICSYSGWNYYVDYEKHLHYYYREDLTAPFALSSSPDGATSVGYRKLKRRRDGTAVRNLYLMFGTNLFSSTQTYYLAGTGAKTAFTLGLADLGRNVILAAPPGEDYILVDKNTGTVGSPIWTAQTVGLDGVDSLTSKDCLHNPTQQTLTFAVAPANLSNAVRVRAVYLLTGGQVDADGGSYAKYGRNFAKKLVAADANSATALASKLANYKTQFAYALDKVTLSVDDGAFPEGSTDRFDVGQWVTLTNGVLGLTARGYLIHKMTTRILGGELKGYDLELRNWFTDTV